MIVLDIETSGLDFEKNGIWQIGAIDLISGEEFLQESKIDKEDEVVQEALNVCRKTEQELRDFSQQTQEQMISNFLDWTSNKKIKNFICQNPQFDVAFLISKIRKYNLIFTFPHRSFDLHTIAQIKYFEINNKFSFDLNKFKSDFDLTNILKFCGIKDKRKAHNALEDCKLTAECFSRLVYGKMMFKEYVQFEIPVYLKNDNL